MTWQPIDEETYIDDTLVTCAEYQLFIDEMREQGKYYQPDHWTSYQFPKGQAQEPILGVRYADAVVFCAWLMQRENGVCTYSLPVQETTKAFPVKSFVPSLLGYWVIEKYQFAWVSSVPEDAREIDIDLALDQGLAPYGTGDVAFNLFSTQNLESALTLADSRSTNCAFINRALVVALDNFRALRLSQALVNELSLAIHY